MSRRRNNNKDPLARRSKSFTLEIDELSDNIAGFTIEEFTAYLKASTTLSFLAIKMTSVQETSENIRRIIEQLCLCIANLRHDNPKHRLITLQIYSVSAVYIDQILDAAKQFGIFSLHFYQTTIRIDSLLEFCRGSTKLGYLNIMCTQFSEEKTTMSAVSSQDKGTQDSSAILALFELTMMHVFLEDSTVANKFRNWIAHVTYSDLHIGGITVRDGKKDDKDASIRIVSELIKKPSVQHLTLMSRCPMEAMDVIAACTTIVRISMHETCQPFEFLPASVQDKLQAIATRNRKARNSSAANVLEIAGTDASFTAVGAKKKKSKY